MKKIFFIIAVIGCISHHNSAQSAVCNATVCRAEDSGYMDLNPSVAYDCQVSPAATCYCSERVLSCSLCPSGYTRTQASVSPSSGGSVKYYYCKKDCTGCSNCTSDTSWSSAGTGYEKKVTRTCDCNTCKSSTAYRCAAGYYGSSSNGTSGCAACPSGSTSSAGSTSKSSCCESAVSGAKDGYGTYSKSACCYS